MFPSLIKRRKNHFHNLPCGISIIIGNNGYIWISPQQQNIVVEQNKDEIDNYEVQVSFTTIVLLFTYFSYCYLD